MNLSYVSYVAEVFLLLGDRQIYQALQWYALVLRHDAYAFHLLERAKGDDLTSRREVLVGHSPTDLIAEPDLRSEELLRA